MRILVFLSIFTFARYLPAQEFLDLDLSRHCHFGGTQQEEELYTFTSGSPVMENLVTEILKLGGDLERNFTLIQTNVESVSAVVVGGNRYLLWSQDYLERATDVQAFASVAHEIGHHVNNHSLQVDRQTGEAEEANLFMGYILSRKFNSDEALQVIFGKDGHQFSRVWENNWLEAAQKGYQKASDALRIATLEFEHDASAQRFLEAAFPFPPPPCYQQLELAPRNFNGCSTLGQVAQKLAQPLAAKKYPRRYLSVPDGFAIVTQIEQYQPDGTALSGADRWKEVPVQEDFALTLSYLKSLVFPRKAHLRVFVFLVTNQNFNAKGKRIEKEVAKDWFSQAVNRLPKSVANAPYTPDHTVEMLVYEFEVPEANQHPKQNCPCHLQAGEHLKKSGLEHWLKP
ncbi:MAG: hypothetical protein R3D58_01375 [Saprospiraceae bacterium]|nr:hypothetical protein [Lewinellaceae bacterium]